MADTSQLNLPLLSPSQAQKHVTVNEALVRLDGLTQLVLASRSVPLPPGGVADGVSYAVPAGAANDWAGQEGKVATAANGGWVFAAPKRGWRAFIADESVGALWDGAGWVAGAVALSAHGAGTVLRVDEFDHAIAPGASSLTTGRIGAGRMVIAVTARVLAPVTGTLATWRLGTAGATDRFGSGLGLVAGSYARGMLSAPMTYWAAEPLVLTAEGGAFAGGQVRLAVHALDLLLPGG